MFITLNPELKRSQYNYRRDFKNIMNRTIQPNSTNEVLVRHDIPRDVVIGYHVSYVEYLQQAYAEHRSIVLTPDIIWYTILCEIAGLVRENSDAYASVFTTNPGKKTPIRVQTDDITTLPMAAVVQALISLMPTDVSVFIPGYSSTTPQDVMAKFTAFADVCSPYYSYSTCLCGFPAIKIIGEVADYVRLVDEDIPFLMTVFDDCEDEKVYDYLLKVEDTLGDLADVLEGIGRLNPVEFFNEMLTTQRCGSGGEVECNGWWVKNMYAKDYSKTKPANLPSHVSRVEYENAETDRKFVLSYGLLYSVDDEGFDYPQWGSVIRELVPTNDGQHTEE